MHHKGDQEKKKIGEGGEGREFMHIMLFLDSISLPSHLMMTFVLSLSHLMMTSVHNSITLSWKLSGKTS